MTSSGHDSPSANISALGPAVGPTVRFATEDGTCHVSNKRGELLLATASIHFVVFCFFLLFVPPPPSSHPPRSSLGNKPPPPPPYACQPQSLIYPNCPVQKIPQPRLSTLTLEPPRARAPSGPCLFQTYLPSYLSSTISPPTKRNPRPPFSQPRPPSSARSRSRQTLPPASRAPCSFFHRLPLLLLLLPSHLLRHHHHHHRPLPEQPPPTPRLPRAPASPSSTRRIPPGAARRAYTSRTCSCGPSSAGGDTGNACSGSWRGKPSGWEASGWSGAC